MNPFVIFMMNGTVEVRRILEGTQLEPLTTGLQEGNHRKPEQLHTLRAT
jgi:hypothetical protein